MLGPQHHGESITRPTFSSNLDELTCVYSCICIHSTGNRVLIFSPNMTHLHLIPGKQVIVQLSKSLTFTPKILHLNVLIQALENDPDLSEIPECLRPQVYRPTGCSFFAGIGKCSMPHLLHLDNHQALQGVVFHLTTMTTL